MNTKELVEQLTTHLVRLEAAESSPSNYYQPSVKATGNYIDIRYRNTAAAPRHILTRKQATLYLAALDAGFVGQHVDEGALQNFLVKGAAL